MGRLLLPSQFIIAISLGLVLTSSYLVTAVDLVLSIDITGVDEALSRIRLLCRDHANRISNAEFVFEGDDGFVVISIEHGLVQIAPGEVEFTITQDIEGLYYCRSPDNSSLRSAGRNFTAYPKRAPDMRIHYIAVAGENVTLSCGVGPGRLATRYDVKYIHLRGNTTNIIRDDRIDPATFSLMLTDVQRSQNTGIYQCCVKVESQGNPYSVPVQDIILDVYERPTLIATRTDVFGGLANTVNFTCNAIDILNATAIFWYHNQVNVTESSKYNHGTRSSTLVLSDIGVNDAGTIACSAVIFYQGILNSTQDEISVIESKAINLSVYKKPTLSGTDVYVLPNTEPVSFTCSATDLPNTTMIHWKHNGLSVNGSMKYAIASPSAVSSTLTVSDIEVSDSGTIFCVVSTNALDLWHEEVMEFSVLSDNFNVNFEINKQGHIILYFTPEATVPDGIQLLVVHTDTKTSTQKNKTIPVSTSTNMVIEVLYFDCEFKLQVGLMKNGAIGPLVPSYAEAMTFLCNPDCSVVSNTSKQTGVIVGVVVGAIVLVGAVITGIIILIIILYCNMKRNRKVNSSENEPSDNRSGPPNLNTSDNGSDSPNLNTSDNGSDPPNLNASYNDSGPPNGSAVVIDMKDLGSSIKLREVLNDVVTVASKWRELGTQLGVPRWELDCIKQHNEAVCQQSLDSVINYWLNNDVTDDEEKKKTLLAAIRSPVIDDISLAEELTSEPLHLDHPTLVYKLEPLAVQWYELGVQLDIPAGTLDTFHRAQEDSTADKKHLLDMLSKWMKGQYSPPQKLIEALMFIKQCRLAETLRPKYEELSHIVD